MLKQPANTMTAKIRIHYLTNSLAGLLTSNQHKKNPGLRQQQHYLHREEVSPQHTEEVRNLRQVLKTHQLKNKKTGLQTKAIPRFPKPDTKAQQVLELKM